MPSQTHSCTQHFSARRPNKNRDKTAKGQDTAKETRKGQRDENQNERAKESPKREQKERAKPKRESKRERAKSPKRVASKDQQGEVPGPSFKNINCSKFVKSYFPKR